jgi:tetratricopeptide (TPR) repeat protein
MRARALTGAGRSANAKLLVHKICSDAALDPDSRAACARLLVELGDNEAALEQAERAHREKPDAPVTIQALAWATCRVAWKRPEQAVRLRPLLPALEVEGGPRRALSQALRAFAHATIGEPERALQSVKAALDLDPKSRDALLAGAVACARLNQNERSNEFIERFAERDVAEARVALKLVAFWLGRDEAVSRRQ